LKRKITLFAPEFYPIPGGISEYTLNLAKLFQRTGQLDYLVTNQFQEHDFGFPVKYARSNWGQLDHSKRNIFVRKVGSLLHNLYVKLFVIGHLIIAKRRNNTVVVNSIFMRLSWFSISFMNLLGIKYGLVLHGLDILEKKISEPQKLKDIILNADEIIVNSNQTLKLLQTELQLDDLRKVRVIHPPFDESVYNKIQLINEDKLFESKFPFCLSEKRVITTVCRLVKRKGVDKAIEVLESVLKSNENWVYLIAGDGEEKDYLKSLIRIKNLHNKVFILGHITEQEKFSLLSKSEIFIMLNHTLGSSDFEGFGISFVEAQYFENVIIGGASGGVVEAVSNGESGFLFDLESNAAQGKVREKVEYLINTPLIMSKMQSSAKKYVKGNFEIGSLIHNSKNEIIN